MVMDGKGMFTHAVTRMAESAGRMLRDTGWTTDALDWCVAHQANVRILHSVADVLDVPRDRMIVHLDRVGNTSAASIPLALTDAAARGVLSRGDRVLATAFGGGLSWASTAFTWPAPPTDGVGHPAGLVPRQRPERGDVRLAAQQGPELLRPPAGEGRLDVHGPAEADHVVRTLRQVKQQSGCLKWVGIALLVVLFLMSLALFLLGVFVK